jgi:hypothetical protein
MKNFAIALATIAALTLGAFSTADAQGKGRRDGAARQRHATVQHRAGSRNFQRGVDRRQGIQRGRIRQGARAGNLNRHEVSRLRRDQRRIGKMERRFGADGRYSRHERRALKSALDRSSKRIWRMKHNRPGRNHGYGKHRRYHKPFHWRHHKRFGHGYGWKRRHFRQVPYPVPVYQEVSPGPSRGLEVETEDFRFKVYGEG